MFDDPATQGRPAAEYVLAKSLAKGNVADAAYHAERFASPAVLRALKALPMSTSTDGELVGSPIQTGFFQALQFTAAFDRMLPSMRRLPAKTRLVASTGITSSAPGEGQTKTVSQLDLSSGMLDPHKAQETVVISEELARSPEAVEFVNEALQSGMGAATDSAFVPAISTGAAEFVASGSDGEALRADLALAITAIGVGAASRLFILMSPARALAVSLMSASAGGQEFPDMTPTGGSISGISVIATDGIETSASPATDDVVVVDASGLAGDAGELVLSSAEHATIDLGGGVVSLWQSNLLGLRAERHFAASVGRPGAVAIISGATYGAA